MYKDTYKIFVGITNYSEIIAYGPGEREMIDMYVNHSLVYQDEEGNDKYKHTRYELRPCNDSDFDLTIDTRFDNDPSKYSCIDDPNDTLSLIGTDRRVRTKDNQ